MADAEKTPPIDTSTLRRALTREGPDRIGAEVGSRLYRFAALLFVLGVLVFYLDAIFRVLLIGFVGAILGVAFNSLVKRIPLGRKASTAIVALAVLGALGVSIWLVVAAVVDQVRGLVEDMPSMLALLESWEGWIQETTGLEIELMGEFGQRLLDTVLGGVSGSGMLAGAIGVFEVMAMALLILMGALFVTAEPNEKLLNPLLRTIPPGKRDAWRRMLLMLGDRLSAWLLGTLVSIVVTGALTAVVFLLIGAPYPLLLAVIVGLFAIIPLIGPWIGGVIAVLVTLFHDPGLAIWVVVSMVAIQEVEGNLVRPLVMSGAANLHPFVTLLSLILFGSIFGVLGAILSLPIVLAIGTAIEVLWVEESLHAADDEIEPVVSS